MPEIPAGITKAEAAQSWAGAGWAVFPLNGKIPAIRGGRGVLDATTDLEQIKAWWDRYPDANVGVRVPENMVVLDVDGPNRRPHPGKGLEALARAEAEHGHLPSTLTQITGSGGLHLVFKRPSGKLSKVGLPAGLEYKDHGGYIVGAQSIHPDTSERYILCPHEIVDMPAWLAEMITTPRARNAEGSVTRLPTVTRTGESIIDQYNAEHTWPDILGPHGWTCGSADPDADGAVWLHPTHTSDCSATIRDGSLYVYSSNTPFDQTSAGDPRGYDKFDAYALLHHGGDKSAAARALRPPTDYGHTDFGHGPIRETGANGQPTPEAQDALDNVIRNRALQIRIERAARRLVDAEERPPVEYPPVRSLPALLAQPCPPTRWRIDQVAPIEARIIASAQYKAGKTTMRDNAVRSLVDREPFLGRFMITQPAEALVLIDNELSEHTVQDWLHRQKIRNAEAVVDVVTLRGKLASFNLFDDDCRAEWAQRFRALGCDYLILDCLRPILDAFGLDENRDAGRFLVQFDAMLEAAGIRDAMLVHHMGHQGERSRGDSRLQDWPDATWRLIREDPDDPASARFFSAYGRDVDVKEGRLAFDESSRRLTYVDGSRGDTKTEAALQAVLAALVADARAGGGGLSGRAIEIAVSDEHTQKSIRAAVRLAHRRELLVKTPGLKNATLHRIAQPCSVCGHPLTAGQGTRHESCVEEAAA